MATKKLINQGQRTINYGPDHHNDLLKPKAVVEFPEELAEKLLKLYPGELIDLEGAIKVFTDSSSASSEEEEETEEDAKLWEHTKPLEELTKAELKKVAKHYDISFTKETTEEDFIALIQAHEASLS